MKFSIPIPILSFVFCCLFEFATAIPLMAAPQSDEEFALQRAQMVEVAVKGAGVTDERVLRAMLATPRHEFVPKKIRRYQSYLDAGIPIGDKQTISSPFIVAFMTQSIDPQPTDKVLEIGTGSGYQAAILSPLVKEVYSIEIVESLGKRAAKVLKKLGYENIVTKIGDGYQGWEEHAPFDKIVVTCSPENIPRPLIDQLKEGGIIVVPMGSPYQQTLFLMQKKDGEMVRKALQPTLFVPMTGTAAEQRQVKPDPSKPALLNGDFEDGLDEKGYIKGWYYERQLTWKEDAAAPSGSHYIEFNSDVPGQLAHLMQGFAIDGEHVKLVKMSISFACEDVKKGLLPNDYPSAVVSFYDEQREPLSTAIIGPFRGTHTWEDRSQTIRVPRATKDAILRVGLFGATGVARFDNIKITVQK